MAIYQCLFMLICNCYVGMVKEYTYVYACIQNSVYIPFFNQQILNEILQTWIHWPVKWAGHQHCIGSPAYCPLPTKSPKMTRKTIHPIVVIVTSELVPRRPAAYDWPNSEKYNYHRELTFNIIDNGSILKSPSNIVRMLFFSFLRKRYLVSYEKKFRTMACDRNYGNINGFEMKKIPKS
jgi:hypothetical protein